MIMYAGKFLLNPCPDCIRIPEGGICRGECPDGQALRLYEAIKHGDEKHRAWLFAALHAYFRGEPIPQEQR